VVDCSSKLSNIVSKVILIEMSLPTKSSSNRSGQAKSSGSLSQSKITENFGKGGQAKPIVNKSTSSSAEEIKNGNSKVSSKNVSVSLNHFMNPPFSLLFLLRRLE
jgi:hypothetical protein